MTTTPGQPEVGGEVGGEVGCEVGGGVEWWSEVVR